MKIREICNRHRFTAADVKALSHLGIETLPEWLVETLFGGFGTQLVIASPSLLDHEHELSDELERRGRQRRRRRPFATGPAEVNSPSQNDAAAAPAVDAGTADAAAPMAMGGPALG